MAEGKKKRDNLGKSGIHFFFCRNLNDRESKRRQRTTCQGRTNGTQRNINNKQTTSTSTLNTKTRPKKKENTYRPILSSPPRCPCTVFLTSPSPSFSSFCTSHTISISLFFFVSLFLFVEQQMVRRYSVKRR